MMKKKKAPPKHKVPRIREEEVKASDVYDMLGGSSDEEEQNETVAPKRQKPNSTSDGSETAESDNESEVEQMAEYLEMEQRKNSKNEAGATKKMKELLPIKTKSGVVPRLVEDSKKKFVESDSDDNVDMDDEKHLTNSEDDSDKEVIEDNVKGKQITQKNNKMSATELLLEREQELQRQKFRIGVICSGILEKPEEKVKNIGALIDLMTEFSSDKKENLVSTRKLAMISLVEVFRDIVPDYKVGVVDLEQQKVKKDTLARVTYENELLKYYKKFLRELENMTKALKRRKYGPRPTKEGLALAEIAIQSLCEALLAQPYFNFSTNIAQVLVTFLNCPNEVVRKKIHETFVKIFKTDKRLDITRHIVRNINHLVKKKSNFVFIEVISCLTSLQIKNINVNAEKEAELKQKRLELHKSRLISMSKRERKRKKKLADLEKEMMETQAEENKQTKNAKLTDISKLAFTIYFRILKQNPNSRLLSSTLEGLAKYDNATITILISFLTYFFYFRFAHIINIEFFSDLIEVLNYLIENVDLGYREQLHCIQTVFTILSGQGEVLNIDPARFYTHLYQNIMHVNAGKNHNDIESIVTTLENVLIKRRKSITHLRYLAFLKRLMTLSLQVLNNGSLGCLGIVKNAMQLNSSLDILLDTENKVGSGRFDPDIVEPEFSNANCTSLFELSLLKRHYHPTVVKFANHIAGGVQINSGLEPKLAKLYVLVFEVYRFVLKIFDSPQISTGFVITV